MYPRSTASILCYHSHRFHGADYSNNDHIALAEDLELIRNLDRTILPASKIVEAVRGDRPWEEIAGAVAITFDDGLCLDYQSYSHKALGTLPNFREQLKQFDACATSFVIASPDARLVLESVSLDGEAMLDEDWWLPAAQQAHIVIGNHSWDHNHRSLPWRGRGIKDTGSFRHVDNALAADWEIAQAQRYFRACLDSYRPTLFAYPHGESSRYLVQEYLPRHGPQLGLEGGFVTGGEYVTPETSPWRIPRFVCGKHWRSSAELQTILASSS